MQYLEIFMHTLAAIAAAAMMGNLIKNHIDLDLAVDDCVNAYDHVKPASADAVMTMIEAGRIEKYIGQLNIGGYDDTMHLQEIQRIMDQRIAAIQTNNSPKERDKKIGVAILRYLQELPQLAANDRLENAEDKAVLHEALNKRREIIDSLLKRQSTKPAWGQSLWDENARSAKQFDRFASDYLSIVDPDTRNVLLDQALQSPNPEIVACSWAWMLKHEAKFESPGPMQRILYEINQLPKPKNIEALGHFSTYIFLNPVIESGQKVAILTAMIKKGYCPPGMSTILKSGFLMPTDKNALLNCLIEHSISDNLDDTAVKMVRKINNDQWQDMNLRKMFFTPDITQERRSVLQEAVHERANGMPIVGVMNQLLLDAEIPLATRSNYLLKYMSEPSIEVLGVDDNRQLLQQLKDSDNKEQTLALFKLTVKKLAQDVVWTASNEAEVNQESSEPSSNTKKLIAIHALIEVIDALSIHPQNAQASTKKKSSMTLKELTTIVRQDRVTSTIDPKTVRANYPFLCAVMQDGSFNALVDSDEMVTMIKQDPQLISLLTTEQQKKHHTLCLLALNKDPSVAQYLSEAVREAIFTSSSLSNRVDFPVMTSSGMRAAIYPYIRLRERIDPIEIAACLSEINRKSQQAVYQSIFANPNSKVDSADSNEDSKESDMKSLAKHIGKAIRKLPPEELPTGFLLQAGTKLPREDEMQAVTANEASSDIALGGALIAFYAGQLDSAMTMPIDLESKPAIDTGKAIVSNDQPQALATAIRTEHASNDDLGVFSPLLRELSNLSARICAFLPPGDGNKLRCVIEQPGNHNNRQLSDSPNTSARQDGGSGDGRSPGCV